MNPVETAFSGGHCNVSIDDGRKSLSDRATDVPSYKCHFRVWDNFSEE